MLFSRALGAHAVVEDLTCANEEHVVGLVKSLHSVHGELRVAHISFEEQGLTANHAIHEEVVLHEVQHFIRHVQRGGDPLGTGCVGDALQEDGINASDTLHNYSL